MKLHRILLLVALTLLVSGCADANHFNALNSSLDATPAGFWRGIWHGICAPFSLVGIMFGMKVGIYEVFNTGNWYNFGFLLGLGALGGGSKVNPDSK